MCHVVTLSPTTPPPPHWVSPIILNKIVYPVILCLQNIYYFLSATLFANRLMYVLDSLEFTIWLFPMHPDPDLLFRNAISGLLSIRSTPTSPSSTARSSSSLLGSFIKWQFLTAMIPKSLTILHVSVETSVFYKIAKLFSFSRFKIEIRSLTFSTGNGCSTLFDESFGELKKGSVIKFQR